MRFLKRRRPQFFRRRIKRRRFPMGRRRFLRLRGRGRGRSLRPRTVHSSIKGKLRIFKAIQRAVGFTTQYNFLAAGTTNLGTLVPIMEAFDAADISAIHNNFVTNATGVTGFAPIAMFIRFEGLYTVKSEATYDQICTFISWKPRYDRNYSTLAIGSETFSDISLFVRTAMAKEDQSVGSQYSFPIGFDIKKVSLVNIFFKITTKTFRLRTGQFKTFRINNGYRYINGSRISGTNQNWNGANACAQLANFTFGRLIHVEGAAGHAASPTDSSTPTGQFMRPCVSIVGNERYLAYPEVAYTSNGIQLSVVMRGFTNTVTTPMVVNERTGAAVNATTI